MSDPVTVYLLHLDPPYRHARHYIGVVRGGERELFNRFEAHLSGRGAKLTAAAVAAGSKLVLSRTWADAPFKMEAKLKARGGAARLCPICLKKEKEIMRFKFKIQGFDGDGEAWSHEGTVDAEALNEAWTAAQRAAFGAVTGGKAIFGRPREGGCRGPYKLTAVDIRLDLGPAN